MGLTATGSRHSLAIVPEVAGYGITPATPVFEDIRHTSVSMGVSKTGIESAEVSSDRQIKNYRHGNINVAGDIGIELSYGSFDTLLAAALCDDWATGTPIVGTDQLKAGVLRKSFTVERIFKNLAIPEYHRYTGGEVDGFSLSVQPDAIISGSFSMLAQDAIIDTAIIAGATYPNATVTEPFDSFSGTINENGVPIGIVTGLELSLENGLNPLFVVGSDVTEEPSIGKSRVTGSLNVYFQSKLLLLKFINEESSSLDFTLIDLDGNAYKFKIPNIKYTGGQPDVAGDGEVTLSLPFQALYDVTEGSNITVERTPI